MISERAFAESYKSFWMENTPFLSEYCSLPEARGRRFAREITIPEVGYHVSLNNIVATTHFRNITGDPDYIVDQSYRDSNQVLGIFSPNYAKQYKLTDNYRKIIIIQAERLASQYCGPMIHDPEFPGYGLMGKCRGDLIIGNVLVEIKANTGKRYNKPFENKDFRQLIVYCALNHLAGNPHKIEKLNLFNPRMGFLWQSDIEGFIYRISGATSIELFNSIGNYLLSLTGGFADADY